MNPVAPYAGQNQSSQIVVPRTISNREQREESCWVMPPYANLFPNGEQGGTAFVPPPIQKTDLWSAMQTWPL
jgi:hypothetical protein